MIRIKIKDITYTSHTSIKPSHHSCTSKSFAILFSQDGVRSRFESDDPLFVFISAALDETNEARGNGLLADIYPILRVSIMDWS